MVVNVLLATPEASVTVTVTVPYTLSGTATGGGTDYTLANGSLSFTSGVRSQDITLTVGFEADKIRAEALKP